MLHTVKEERNIIYTVKKRRKANWIGHVLCRNCFLEQVIKGKVGGRMKVAGRRRRRRKQVLDK